MVCKTRIRFLRGRILDNQVGKGRGLQMSKLQEVKENGGPLEPIQEQGKNGQFVDQITLIEDWMASTYTTLT